MTSKVSYIIQLKDQFSAVADKISGKMTDLKNKINSVGTEINKSMSFSFKNIRDETADLIKGAATLSTVLGTIKIGAAFQDARAEISAISGATGSALKEMADDSKRMAKQFGLDQSIVARAMTLTASAKSELLKTPGAVAKVTAEALRLSKAAGVEIPDAIKASIGSLNQWNAGADQAARFVNVLAAGAKVGSSEVADTAQALENAGTVAALFNVTFEETNALLQVMAKNEVKGAEAGTALRGTLSKLEKIAGGRFAPSKIGIINSLKAIEKLGMSNSKIIKEFGEENLRSILILKNNIPLIEQWTNELTGTGVAGEQAATRMDTFNAKVSKLGASIKSIAISVFDGFEPVLSWVVEKVTFIINAIEAFFKVLGGLIGQTASAIRNLDFGSFDFHQIAQEFGVAMGLERLPNFVEAPKNAPMPMPIRAPEAPINSVNGSVNGQILVSAMPGTAIKSTTMTNNGPGLNIGLNMAGAR